VLYAAIAIYLLLGAVFVPVYGLVDTLTFELSGGTLHAFVGGSAGAGNLFAWQDFIYFSHVTLTTLGYGDILPVTMVAKAAVAFEAIIGVMYLTIIMARLVSLYSADFNRKTSD
jgi:voltage-gated potassium channel